MNHGHFSALWILQHVKMVNILTLKNKLFPLPLCLGREAASSSEMLVIFTNLSSCSTQNTLYS